MEESWVLVRLLIKQHLVLFGGVVKAAIPISTPSGVNIFVGINNTTPVHTLDIVNRVSAVNAFDIKNAAASLTISL